MRLGCPSDNELPTAYKSDGDISGRELVGTLNVVLRYPCVENRTPEIFTDRCVIPHKQ